MARRSSPPATPQGVGTWVRVSKAADPAKHKARWYVNTDTGEMIDRRTYDQNYGRLKRANIRSNEEQAKLRREAGLPVGPGRKKKPISAPPRRTPAKPPRPKSKKQQEAEERSRRRAAGLKGTRIFKRSTESTSTWRAKMFPSVDEAAFFTTGFLREFFPEEVYMVNAHGVLSPDSGSDPDEYGERVLEMHVAWKTILGLTDVKDAPLRVATMERNAAKLFAYIDKVEVLWRVPTQGRGRSSA